MTTEHSKKETNAGLMGQKSEAEPSATQLPEEPSYPPQDGGKKAWLFLIGACIVEITAWGFPYCYGVFLEYFIEHEPFKGKSIVSVGGMLANGVLQISLPPIIYFLNNFPSQRKNAMWLGCLICGVAPIGGAFTTSPVGLIMCLGLLYGLGAGLLFAPSMHFLSDWFVKRKSLAYGFICGAGAAAGSGLPPVYTYCLNQYGHKATLVGWGLITIVITSFGLIFVNSRTPAEKAPKPTRRDFDFLKKPLFHILLTATVVQALAHYGPSVYLPSIGSDFGLSFSEGAMLVSLLNLAQAIGQPLQGLLADYRASFYIPFVFSTFGGGLESLLIWPFARKIWSLAIYSLAFGATAGGFAVLRPRFAAAVVGDDGSTSEKKTPEEEARAKNKSMLIFGVFTASRGTAIAVSGFVTEALVDQQSADISGYGAGSKWRNLMIYTGVTMTVASLGALGQFITPISKNEATAEEENA